MRCHGGAVNLQLPVNLLKGYIAVLAKQPSGKAWIQPASSPVLVIVKMSSKSSENKNGSHQSRVSERERT